MSLDLTEDQRTALLAEAVEAARTDPVAWCQLIGNGEWEPYHHARLMLDTVREECENGDGRVIVSVSVGTGKSETVVRGFNSWWLGSHPRDRIIGGAAGQSLANHNSQGIRDALTEWGGRVFGTYVNQTSRAKNQWGIAGSPGGYLAVGRGASPEGFRGHVCIDDPYGSFMDAMSPTSRTVAREWWQNSLRPRMNPGCWAIVICSRWHVDDLSGWLKKEFGQTWREIRLPALCDDPEGDPMGRALGESIWPERWSLDALAKARAETVSEGGEITWSARYQQTPLSMAGRMFPEDKWVEVSTTEGLHIVKRARGWDLAASEAAGDWTIGVLMAKLDDGRYLIEDVVRVQAGPDGVRALMTTTAAADRGRIGPPTTQVIPQDPGQAGKDQVTQLARLLSPSPTLSRAISGSKEIRAQGYASLQRTESVLILHNDNTLAFRAVHSSFPGGAHDDDVDAAADAFNFLASGVSTDSAGTQTAYAGLGRMTSGLG